ncbi:hypothetical protein NP493_213g01008 [Ridgeia piscesae]|uniref:Tim44-like domain-containing protein n=1 Tax=Ridgeia piscesae TaxID=27915 RepID=A0AAD9P0X4_RIDPI|nr:hypothetical protein NP493_213g01008 [Ridgeia piscesae]
MSWKLCERLLIPLTVVGHHAKQPSQLSRYSTLFCRRSTLSRHIPVFPVTSLRILSSPVVPQPDVDRSLFHREPRRYCSGDKSKNDNDVQKTTVSGYIVHVPHPIRWLKTKLYEYILRTRVEPSFDFSEFLVGCKQAISYFTRLAATSNYSEMANVASDQVVQQMQETLLTWTLEQQCSIELTPGDMSIVKPNITNITRQEDSYLVDIDVLCLALKNHDSGPLFIELVLRFNREYTEEDSGEWRISNVNHLSVKEFSLPPKDE